MNSRSGSLEPDTKRLVRHHESFRDGWFKTVRKGFLTARKNMTRNTETAEKSFPRRRESSILFCRNRDHLGKAVRCGG